MSRGRRRRPQVFLARQPETGDVSARVRERRCERERGRRAERRELLRAFVPPCRSRTAVGVVMTRGIAFYFYRESRTIAATLVKITARACRSPSIALFGVSLDLHREEIGGSSSLAPRDSRGGVDSSRKLRGFPVVRASAITSRRTFLPHDDA